MVQYVRYSEAFKLQVIRDLERGRFKSAKEASEAHGIGGATTVSRWAEIFGREQLLQKVVRVSKKGEASELKRMKERIRQLEAALADAVMDSALDRGFFRALCRELNIDGESFKKKHAAALSKKPPRKEREGGA